jgi:archaellum component FlaC
MKKWYLPVFAIFEALIIIGILIIGTVIYLNNKSSLAVERKTNQTNLSTVNEQLNLSKKNISTLNTHLTDASTKLNTCQDQLKTSNNQGTACLQKDQGLQSDLTKANTDLQTLKTQSDAISNELSSMTSEYNDAAAQVTKLNNSITCSFSISGNLDYTDNSAISKSLSNWVGENDGTVTKATWDIVYNNSKTSIHKINGQKYLWVFVVDFSADKNDKNSVYMVGPNCFLDLPK